ncbi:MAG: alpha/beta fold hydrolase [Chitinophagaceae bacterium]|nr:alpha/beta fold hydrolase [Chitinophagaceae bacterium]
MKTFITILFTFFTSSIIAQNTPGVTGTWEGKIQVGVELRIVFHFTKDSSGAISGTSDSPDQGVKGIPCSNIILRNDSLFLEVPSIHGSYNGKFMSDSIIKGVLTQGRSIDLNLKKTDKVSVLLRPQTPKPPYAYNSDDVEYDNADKTLHYGATITTPKGAGPFPAILLITGSGAQNRDEEILGHKPFAVIAHYLTTRGYIVLRVDDRGMGKSSQGSLSATTADFAKDVNTSLNYLKNRKDVNINHLGMIGHSEGGMIAPMVATQRNDIDFIIMLAGPGEKISKLMEDQNAAIMLSAGMSKEMTDAYIKLYHNLIPVIVQAKNPEEAKIKLYKEVGAWRKTTPQNIVMATTGITNDSLQRQFVNAFASSLGAPWYKYFLQFDPSIYLTKLHCKVLALNGDKDIQVISQPNLAAIKAALKKSKSPAYVVKEMPGLNHLFQHCKKCTVKEYGELEETFSPEVLQIMGDWLNENVKK